VASHNAGIVRLPRPQDHQNTTHKPRAALDSYSLRDGLSSSIEHALLTDSEGNVWSGGSRGLDRFTHATLVPIIAEAREGSWSTCTNPQGEIWIASDDGTLFVVRHGVRTLVDKLDGILKLYCGRNGNVWLLNSNDIAYIHRDRLHRLPPLPGQPPYSSRKWNYLELLELPNQGLIVSQANDPGAGLWKYKDSRWKQISIRELSVPFLAMLLDHAGNLYLGRTDGQISVLRNGSVYTSSTGTPGVGVVTALAQSSSNIFALGMNGIAFLQGSHFQMLAFARPELAYTVTGLVESRDHDIWINGSRGIVRIMASEMQKALSDSRHKILCEEIHEGDFVGPATYWKPTLSAAMDSNGKLWFSTLNGVVSLDPESNHYRHRLPQLSIRSISADGKGLANNTFPSNIQTLHIKYFGINLTHPDKVFYRYRLVGLDNTWQDADRRTDAIYTHLRPGTYSFQVVASSGGGNWSVPVTSLRFRVLPHFYQTLWFIALCILAGSL
jgi:ligand-binding sensor domain-containing protein